MNTSEADLKSGYRFKHVTMNIMLDDMKFSKSALKPGQTIPDVYIYNLDGSVVNLSKLHQEKPLMLITVSLTCPMTTSCIPRLPELQKKLGDDINLALVYVREPHPAEEIPQPLTIEEKIEHAEMFKLLYQLDVPMIIDDIDGKLHYALDILPNSVHMIDKKGEILFQSMWLTDIAFVDKAIKEVRLGKSVSNKVSQKMLKPLMLGIGSMDKTFSIAGPRAYKEMFFAAPPMYLMSKFASWLSFIEEPNRGKWAMMAFGILSLIAIKALFCLV